MKQRIQRLGSWFRQVLGLDLELLWKVSLEIIPILILYFGLRVGLYRITLLVPDSYYSEVLFWEFLRKITLKIYPLFAIVIFCFVFRKRLFIKWSSLGQSTYVRNFVLFIAFILTWMFAFYDYNFLLDRAHGFDRILLIVLLIASVFRPFFILPFISVVLVIIGQFELVSGYSLADGHLLIQLLLVFIVFFVLKIVLNRFNVHHFVFLVSCIVASSYIFSGIGKANIGWILYDQVNYFVPIAYSGGWLTFFDIEQINTITRSMALFNIPIKVFTLIVELGFLMFFLQIKWTRYLLIATILLHLGIFAFSGIFFWSWIAVHLFLLSYFLKEGVFQSNILYQNKTYLYLSFAIIISSYFWNNPLKLFWYDVPLTYSYHFKATLENGETMNLSKEYFSPNDYAFKLGGFNYLQNKKLLPVTLGATRDKKLMAFFVNEKKPQEIFDFELSYGYSQFNKEQENALRALLLNFIREKNHEIKDKTKKRYWGALKAPKLLWHYAFGNYLVDPQYPIRKLEIECSTDYYSISKGYRVLRTEKVCEILIPENQVLR